MLAAIGESHFRLTPLPHSVLSCSDCDLTGRDPLTKGLALDKAAPGTLFSPCISLRHLASAVSADDLSCSSEHEQRNLIPCVSAPNNRAGGLAVHASSGKLVVDGEERSVSAAHVFAFGDVAHVR